MTRQDRLQEPLQLPGVVLALSERKLLALSDEARPANGGHKSHERDEAAHR